MKTIVFTFALFLGFMSEAQDQYTQKMVEALASFQNVNSIDDYKKSAMTFERIANAAPEKWLPAYYQAQCYIMIGFSGETLSSDEKDQFLDQGKMIIDSLVIKYPNESEIFALEALYYTGKLVINPMNRASKYTPLTNAAIARSLAIDSNNPRAQQLSLSNRVGTAQFFGEDIQPFCLEAQELLNNWDDYELKSPFHPNWGKSQVLSIIQNCQDSNESLEKSEEDTLQQGHQLMIIIRNLKTDNGVIMLELVNENNETIRQTMGQIENGIATIEFNELDKGSYAIRYYHDENKNGKMDTNKYGIPKEKYGFSNNARGFMGPPKMKKMLFAVEGDTKMLLKCK
jgi:uncharacterized protein (DUF2141 family)